MSKSAEMDLATLGALVRRVGDTAMAESRAFALAHESATPEALAHLYDTHLDELNAVQAMMFMIDLLAIRHAGLRVAPVDATAAAGEGHDFHHVHLRWTECVIAVSVATLDLMREEHSPDVAPPLSIPMDRRVHQLNVARFAERQSRTAMERMIDRSQGV